MGTGETIAFFESPGVPPPAPKPHAAYHTFEHLALEVPTRDDVDAWRAWLVADGFDVITNDHGIIYSIYFRDPVNDIRLEITTTTVADWNARETSAQAALDEWARTKREARAAAGTLPRPCASSLPRAAIPSGSTDPSLAARAVNARSEARIAQSASFRPRPLP